MWIAPRAGEAIGKVLLEVGKALGKAVIAGVGLELARAATGHVKKAVGPRDDKDPPKDAAKDAAKEAAPAPATADDIERIRRENALLREELESLKRELRKVPVDKVDREH